jgi:hypothetical protein
MSLSQGELGDADLQILQSQNMKIGAYQSSLSQQEASPPQVLFQSRVFPWGQHVLWPHRLFCPAVPMRKCIHSIHDVA